MVNTAPVPPTSVTLYDADFHAWTQTQANLLRSGQWDQLDLENLIEELDSLGRQERQQLENRLEILLGHLLKWQFQPDHRSKSWLATLREQRRKIRRHIQKNPSLQPYIPEALLEGYADGLDLAVRETELSYEDFPMTCPYTFEDAMDDNFLPD
jgi:Domain of unknown function DUF29